MSTPGKLRTTLILSSAALAVALLIVSPWWILLAYLALLFGWLAFTHAGQQSWSVAQVGLATLPQRLGSSAVVAIGIAGVVGVLVAILAIAAGFERTLRQTGSDRTAIVLSAGAQTETASGLEGETVSIVSQLPQILRNGQGRPIASAELLVFAVLPKKSNGLDANIAMRGVGERGWELRPNLKLVAGRRFQPGLAELMVGKDAHQQFVGLDLGATMRIDGQPWTVVGLFDSSDAHNSEIWGDAQAVASANRRGNSVNSLLLQLTDKGAVDALKAATASDPRLKVTVETTQQFYNRQAEKFARMIAILGVAIGAIMGLGATFGALNATYSAVAGRMREIATLRAIGFRTVPVIVSVLLETMLLAAVGGAIGALAAWAVFDGFTASTAGASGHIAFALAVSPDLLVNSLKWALAMGLVGGLFPALRAAHMPVAAGLREI